MRNAAQRFSHRFRPAPAMRSAARCSISSPWRDKVQPGYERPAQFFARLRGLMMTGFYTLPEGMADIGYMGNKPVLGAYPGPTPEAMAHLNASHGQAWASSPLKPGLSRLDPDIAERDMAVGIAMILQRQRQFRRMRRIDAHLAMHRGADQRHIVLHQHPVQHHRHARRRGHRVAREMRRVEDDVKHCQTPAGRAAFTSGGDWE